MYEVIVLKEGYNLDRGKGCQRADGSVTLLKGRHNIIVDTGSPRDKDKILTALKANGMTPENINYVVCTHGHVDHVGNLNLFQEAVHIVSYDICIGDNYVIHDFKSGIPYEIDDFVEVVATPGHTGADVSVLVKTLQHGNVLVSGDLFECEEDLENPELWQENSENCEMQEESRIQMLKYADYIVPGHGTMFKVPDEYKRHLRVMMIGVYQELNFSNIKSSIEYTVLECD
ncbi:hypothetical protein SNE40_000946 [Patella caerulea]|uniref:Metallo-beta-lactamase domain-containing protein 1 n=1 Tax=Patella caerulea TaxID=87958 RepID=A0AAN8Q2X3_PATCE